jgi:hypothetical protein
VVEPGGEEILLNLDYVKKIRRIDRVERADIVEDFDGKHYECRMKCGDCTCIGYQDCIIDI